MAAKILKPKSNWHRLVHLLDRNGGMLYIAQLYKPRQNQPEHPEVIRDGMPQLTEYSLMRGRAAMGYERQAERMGWVNIQRYRGRVWVTLLPKGRSVLKAFEVGASWNSESNEPVRILQSIHKTIQLQGDAA